MKRIILAASALSMTFAAPAFAQFAPASQIGKTVAVQGSVAAQCGKGNQSGGGDVLGGGETVEFGALTDANGQLKTGLKKEISFGNLWCNSKSSYSITVTSMSTNVEVADTSSFTNKLDLTLSGKILDTYFGGGTVVTGPAKTGTVGGAFETGNGQFSKGEVAISLPAGTQGNDRPVAGSYKGTVTISLTPAA